MQDTIHVRTRYDKYLVGRRNRMLDTHLQQKNAKTKGTKLCGIRSQPYLMNGGSFTSTFVKTAEVTENLGFKFCTAFALSITEELSPQQKLERKVPKCS